MPLGSSSGLQMLKPRPQERQPQAGATQSFRPSRPPVLPHRRQGGKVGGALGFQQNSLLLGMRGWCPLTLP